METLEAQKRPLPVIAAAPQAFHLLSKPSGSTCNINCAYCFFPKRLFIRTKRAGCRKATLEEYIRPLLGPLRRLR